MSIIHIKHPTHNNRANRSKREAANVAVACSYWMAKRTRDLENKTKNIRLLTVFHPFTVRWESIAISSPFHAMSMDLNARRLHIAHVFESDDPSQCCSIMK